MAKKRRTAAQKRATAKLVAMNKRRKRKTTTRKRRVSVRKTVRRTVRRVRKSTTLKRPKRRKSMRKGMKSLTSSSTLKKVALGVGGATMAAIAVSAIAPQFSRVAAPAGAYFLGGIEGVLGNFALDFIKGRAGSGTTAQNAAPAMEVL